MAARRWLGRLLWALLGAAALALGAALWLAAGKRFLVVERHGGDQSQSSPVDFAARPVPPPLVSPPPGPVRNVILILGDGMGLSHLVAARSELVGLNGRLFLERFPYTGWQTTHTLQTVYTDSAATASALATGQKVPYYRVSTDAEGRPLPTLAEAAMARDMAVGLVTDSYLWDATMAAFLTHVASRDEFGEIARQMALSGVAFLAGESLASWPSSDETAAGGAAPFDLFRHQGFQLIRSPTLLELLPPDDGVPVLALFAPGQVADAERPPALVDLARAAHRRLSGNAAGYLLVVESEEPDSGAHNRNLGRIVRGVRALDDVARLAVDAALAEGSTLVLVTSDHESGGIDILHGDADHTLGVRWSTTSHTAEPVPIFAYGPGAERFTGVKDNTDIPRILADLLGLGMFDHHHPQR